MNKLRLIFDGQIGGVEEILAAIFGSAATVLGAAAGSLGYIHDENTGKLKRYVDTTPISTPSAARWRRLASWDANRRSCCRAEVVIIEKEAVVWKRKLEAAASGPLPLRGVCNPAICDTLMRNSLDEGSDRRGARRRLSKGDG